ncbi:MAG TPA: hypothetical protein VJ372_07570 [Pyrinomonadaceae bacterium]|jgi:hypothetical protein|nr:hypothetical protein [Pyrinomonadaceae bacterium]
MNSEATIESTATEKKLFSLGQIVLATFLGAPLAGSLLVAHNYRVLQKANASRQSIVYGVASTVLIFIIAFLLPEKFPNSVLPVVYCIAMRQLVSYVQGGAIAAHYSIGGAKGSWAIATVVGVGCLVALFAIIFASLTLYEILQ